MTPNAATRFFSYAGMVAIVVALGAKEFALDRLTFTTQSLLPRPHVADTVALHVPGYALSATAASYGDELFSYLMFDYLKPVLTTGGKRLVLTFDARDTGTPYRIALIGQNDLVAALADVTALQATGAIPATGYALVSDDEIRRYELQTRLFVSAYSLPVRKKLEQLPRKAISDYLQRFIQFKSQIDPRVRRKLEPVPKTLSPEEAQRLAGDILTVAEFYSLPLEFFLGIAAMENNYMNVRGDLEHSIWKKRAAPDDIVLERRRGRVRVLNDSAGVWQITRETLRQAHNLFTRDSRNYALLPQHLHPPADFSVNDVSPPVLTTYAGLLLRDLLDRFDGDVTLAVSAYNGGPGRPNLRYGHGVRVAAEHARRVVEQAAALNGESVVRTTWLRRL